MRKPKTSSPQIPVSSKKLEEQLGNVLRKRREIEKNFQEKHQKYWIILFIDVSESVVALWEHGQKTVEQIYEEYQKQVRAILESLGAAFIEPGGGAQIVVCFEDPANALFAAHAVRQLLSKWEYLPGIHIHLPPTIGGHIGYIVYENETIRQSNTNNLAKRIQSQAQPGQILISSALSQALQNNPQFAVEYVGTAPLKNIPEPQDLYEVNVTAASPDVLIRPIVSCPMNSTDETEKSIHHWLLVCIDVCESTRKFWSYGDLQAGELIRQYQVVCRETFNACGCSYVHAGEGDQIIAGFNLDQSVAAATAAVGILQGLFRRNVNVPTQKQVRAAIGIHAGEVILQDKQLIPTKDLQVVKTIQSLAAADEILLSQEVQQALFARFKDHLAEYDRLELPEIQESHVLYTLKWFHVHTKPLGNKPSVVYGKRLV